MHKGTKECILKIIRDCFDIKEHGSPPLTHIFSLRTRSCSKTVKL